MNTGTQTKMRPLACVVFTALAASVFCSGCCGIPGAVIGSIHINLSGDDTRVVIGGEGDYYTVTISHYPLCPVHIIVRPADANIQVDAGGDPGTEVTLTFTSDNWETPQRINVTSTSGTAAGTYMINHILKTCDTQYKGLSIDSVEVVTVEDTSQPAAPVQPEVAIAASRLILGADEGSNPATLEVQISDTGVISDLWQWAIVSRTNQVDAPAGGSTGQLVDDSGTSLGTNPTIGTNPVVYYRPPSDVSEQQQAASVTIVVQDPADDNAVKASVVLTVVPASPSLRVTPVDNGLTFLPGQLVNLNAIISGGQAPYTYQWAIVENGGTSVIPQSSAHLATTSSNAPEQWATRTVTALTVTTLQVTATDAVGDTATNRTQITTEPLMVSVDGMVVTEGDNGVSVANFTVTLDTPATVPVSVDYNTADGSATAGEDYEAVSGTLNFAVGEDTKTIPVNISGDLVDEGAAETFTLTLSNPVNAGVTKAIGTGTITDDDRASLSVADATVTEGDEGTKTLEFNVSLSNPSVQTVSATFTTQSGTATAGEDYQASTGMVSFVPGSTSGQTIIVDIIGDVLDENDETFTVSLSAPSNASISTGNATGTIVDNDTTTVSIFGPDGSTVEGSDGQTDTIDFTISLSNPHSSAITVDVATVDASGVGIATGGPTGQEDYDAVNTQLTFPAGSTSAQNVSVIINGDNVDEGTLERLTVRISNATTAGGQILAITSPEAEGVIEDDDTTTVSVADIEVTDPIGNSDVPILGHFAVTLSHPHQYGVTVQAACVDGTATMADGDYTPDTREIVFGPYEDQQICTVLVTDDGDNELTETFQITLTGATDGVGNGVTIDDATATCTIIDEDVSYVSITSMPTHEPGIGVGTKTFTIMLDPASPVPVTIMASTKQLLPVSDNGDGLATEGEDYEANSSNITFDAYVPTGQFQVTINADDIDDGGPEVFAVELEAVAGGEKLQLPADDGLGVIIDHPEDVAEIQVNDVMVQESDGSADFAVTLSIARDVAVAVDYSTEDASAMAGQDYDAVSNQQLQFDPGMLTPTIGAVSVTLLNDLLQEQDETFDLVLWSLFAAEARGTATIVDDDQGIPVE